MSHAPGYDREAVPRLSSVSFRSVLRGIDFYLHIGESIGRTWMNPAELSVSGPPSVVVGTDEHVPLHKSRMTPAAFSASAVERSLYSTKKAKRVAFGVEGSIPRGLLR